jgi:hypothetical protein
VHVSLRVLLNHSHYYSNMSICLSLKVVYVVLLHEVYVGQEEIPCVKQKLSVITKTQYLCKGNKYRIELN